MSSFLDNLKVKHDFILSNVDTDAISIAKQDLSPFSPEERQELLNELNDQFPELIKFSDDGYYDSFIVVASKNYVLANMSHPNPKKRIQIKGASLKATRGELYLKEFIHGVLHILLDENFTHDQIIDLYNKAARDCVTLKDMSRHSKKVSITEKLLKGDDLNALKVKLALKGVNYQQGDKFRMFYLENENLCLEGNFNGEYCKRTLLSKLFATTKIFKNILPEIEFINHSLLANYYPFIGESRPPRKKKEKKDV